jgi:hypothetical protein
MHCPTVSQLTATGDLGNEIRNQVYPQRVGVSPLCLARLLYRPLSFLLPVTCLGDVYRVSLDLVAVTAIGVVGRLYRFGADFPVFERQDNFVRTYRVLLPEDSLKGLVTPIVISFEKFDKTVHQFAWFYHPDVDLSLCAAVYRLVPLFVPDAFNQGKLLF